MKNVRTLERRWIALPLALMLAGCSEKPKVVVQVQSEKEANEILVALREYAPEKDPVKSGQNTVYQIKVASPSFQDALQVLLQNNLPRNKYGGFESMLDSAGLIPTKTDERARFLHAREQELEESLELIDGVLNARVHLVMPEKDRYESARRERAAAKEDADGVSGASPAAGSEEGGATASVILRYDPRRLQIKPVEDLQSRVASVVANAVEGLHSQRVEVFTQPAILTFAASIASNVNAPSSDDSSNGGEIPADESAALKSAGEELETAKRDRNYAIISSVVLAVLLLFALIRSMKRR